MESNTPVLPDSSARPAGQPLIPPEERFWQHYSAHGEFPLSSVSSFAMHALVVGVLLLWGLYLAALFNKPKNAIPVEAVTLDVGGGGGDPAGTPGGGQGPPRTEVTGPTTPNPPSDTPPDTPKREDLSHVVVPEVRAAFIPEDARLIEQAANAQAAKVFASLQDQARRTAIPDNTPRAQGKGGPGKGGGEGDGQGPGKGSDKGPGGQGRLTQRQKRMLRWSMSFMNTASGRDYVEQLRGLGAILAVPVREVPPGQRPEYKVIRDLSRRPAELLDEDVTKLDCIFWSDSDPRSVSQVMTELGIQLAPSHFVAFMPQGLEKQLFEMERTLMKQMYPGLTEDRIQETRFRVVRTPTGYMPQIVSLTPKVGG